MASWTSSSPTTLTLISITCRNSERAGCVSTRVYQFNVAPEVYLELVIRFTTTTAMAHSQTCRRRLGCRILTDTTAWEPSVATSTRTAGLIFLWRMIQRRTSYITTTVTARLRRSGFSRELQLMRMGASRDQWV